MWGCIPDTSGAHHNGIVGVKSSNLLCSTTEREARKLFEIIELSGFLPFFWCWTIFQHPLFALVCTLSGIFLLRCLHIFRGLEKHGSHKRRIVQCLSLPFIFLRLMSVLLRTSALRVNAIQGWPMISGRECRNHKTCSAKSGSGCIIAIFPLLTICFHLGYHKGRGAKPSEFCPRLTASSKALLGYISEMRFGSPRAKNRRGQEGAEKSDVEH